MRHGEEDKLGRGQTMRRGEETNCETWGRGQTVRHGEEDKL